MSTSAKLKAAILVISDTAAQDSSQDKSGPLLQDVFRDEGGEKWEAPQLKIVPDDVLEIQRTVMQWTDSDPYMNFIVTSGGTGFSGKDNTPEVRFTLQ